MKEIYFNEATIVDDSLKKAIEKDVSNQKKHTKVKTYREGYYN